MNRSDATVRWTVVGEGWTEPNHDSLKSLHLRQQKENFCLPKVLFLFIQAAGLAYHHDAVVNIIKGGSPPLYIITRQRASTCGLMRYNASH